MEPVQTLSADALDTDVSPSSAKAESRPLPLKRLLLLSLLLNGALAGGVAAAAARLDQRLDALAQHAQANAQSNERQHTELAALTAHTATLETGLTDVRTAVSSHAREEALFLKILILKPSVDHALARRIASTVQKECLLFGQDPNLVLAIMAYESDFNPAAVSSQGAVGLMQVMPHWKKVLGLQELAEPEVSIRAGIQILGFYQQMYRDLDLALTAYNRGPGPVDGALVRGSSPANGYAAKVLSTWERLKALDVSAHP